MHLTFFNFVFFPILNFTIGFKLLKSVIHIKFFSTVFFGPIFLFGMISQRLIYYYRKMIIKKIKLVNDKKLGIVLNVKLLSGKKLSDSIENIEIKVSDNDYVSPEYVFTSEDVNKISYFIFYKILNYIFQDTFFIYFY